MEIVSEPQWHKILSKSAWVKPPQFNTLPSKHMQRQGIHPWTESLITGIRSHDMTKMATQEILGSNVPLVVGSSTVNEASDQGVFQAAETFNAFGVSLAINRTMKDFVDEHSETWGKGTHQSLTKDQEMWKRFTLSMPLFAWLVGVEFFTPLLRNMITLKRTQELEFTKITSIHNTSLPQETDKAKQERLQSDEHQASVNQKMAEYQALAKRDFLIAIPTALALFGVGMMGLKHNWKMPKLILDTPALLDKVLGKAHPQEQGMKKAIRSGVNKFVGNLFGSEQYEAHKGRLDLINEALLPNGDWLKVSPLMTTLVFAMPTYIALSAYSRDDVEKSEIWMRAGAYALANLVFPNAVETFVKRTVKEGTYIKGIGGHENIALVARLLTSTILYSGLPILATRLTRPWRAKHLQEKHLQEKQNEKKASVSQI